MAEGKGVGPANNKKEFLERGAIQVLLLVTGKSFY